MSAAQRDVGGLRDQSLGELLSRLVTEIGTLIRQEADLAKAEMREKAAAAKAGGAMLAAGVVVGLMASGALTAFLVLGLAAVMPAWVAALIVAVVLALVAWVAFSAGMTATRRAMPPVPEATAEKVKEDVAWVKERTRSELR